MLKLVVFVGAMLLMGLAAYRGALPRTRPIVPGELMVADWRCTPSSRGRGGVSFQSHSSDGRRPGRFPLSAASSSVSVQPFISSLLDSIASLVRLEPKNPQTLRSRAVVN